MYLGIFPDQYPGQVLVTPNVFSGTGQTQGQRYGNLRTYTAHYILEYIPAWHRFKLLKDRSGSGASAVAAKHFGLNVDADGYFIDERDGTLFLLKYGGLREEIPVDFPLI